MTSEKLAVFVFSPDGSGPASTRSIGTGDVATDTTRIRDVMMAFAKLDYPTRKFRQIRRVTERVGTARRARLWASASQRPSAARKSALKSSLMARSAFSRALPGAFVTVDNVSGEVPEHAPSP
jgi:hypothetical protein